MTYPDFVAARQLIAERRFGAPIRSAIRAREAEEQAAVEATKAAIRRDMARSGVTVADGTHGMRRADDHEPGRVA